MTIELSKHYENGKLVNVIKTIKKTEKELNDWYDFEEIRLEHEQEINDND